MTFLPTGKLPNRTLSDLLETIPTDPDVLLGPGVGHDVAIAKLGGGLVALKCDPVTFATDHIGWYALNVNANDLATVGATPRFFLSTILIPPNTKLTLIEDVFIQITEAASGLGITVVGGHTEITDAVNRLVVCGTMIGEVGSDSLIYPSGLMAGDVIVMSGGPAIEATAIIAREMPKTLSNAGLSKKEIAEAVDFLFDPGIGVVNKAQTAVKTVQVHAMHDPTEGGVATALQEMATASGVGLFVMGERIVAHEYTRRVCEAVGVDVLGAISSGSLLIGIDAGDADRLVKALHAVEGRCEIVAQVTEIKSGLKWTEGGKDRPWPVFERDEIARLFDETALS